MNDLKDKYLLSKLFFRHEKTIFIIQQWILTTLQTVLYLLKVVSIDLEGYFYRSLMKKGQKWPITDYRVVNSLKNQQKWPKLSLSITEWSSKYRLLDQYSQSFTSRDKSSEYLARFKSLKKIRNIIFYLPVEQTLTGQKS